MTDEQFDDLAKKALALDAGPPNERIWNKSRPIRWSWLPTVRESIVCGSVCALALLVVGMRVQHKVRAPNPIIQAAMQDETRYILSSVTRMDGMELEPKSKF